MTTPGDILNAVARRTGVTRFELVGPCRRPRFVHARRVAALVMRGRRYSLKEIGSLLNRDHTSILHLLQSASDHVRGEAIEVVGMKGGA